MEAWCNSDNSGVALKMEKLRQTGNWKFFIYRFLTKTYLELGHLRFGFLALSNYFILFFRYHLVYSTTPPQKSWRMLEVPMTILEMFGNKHRFHQIVEMDNFGSGCKTNGQWYSLHFQNWKLLEELWLAWNAHEHYSRNKLKLVVTYK